MISIKELHFRLHFRFLDSFCIEVTSSENQPCSSHFKGGAVYFKFNGAERATIPANFRYFEYCLRSEEVDVLNDRFELKSSNNNAVCIFSLTINGTQILNGRNNNQTAFWLDKNQRNCDYVFDNKQYLMITPHITIQNNQVISSPCQGK